MKKTTLLSFVAIGFLLILMYFFYSSRVETIKKHIYQNKSIALKQVTSELIKHKKDNTAIITYILSQNKNLSTILENEGNYTNLDYKKLIQGIQKIGEYKNLWINIINDKGINIYRSWSDKHGDDVKPYRIDIVNMLKNHTYQNTISTGKYDITFKTMFPIYSQKKFLGIIETITHFNSIAKQLQSMHILSLLLVEPAYSKKILYPFNNHFLSNYYLANLNASPQLAKEVSSYGVKKILTMDQYRLFGKYLVTDYIIPSIYGDKMAHFLLFYPLEKLDISKVREFTIRFLIFTIGLMILFILIGLLILNRRYVRKLNKEVAEKTKAIQAKSNELAALVQIYDKTVIFSQTDLEGNITKVSEAFCRTSGYLKDELINTNHNIIRHPDMPRSIFEHLWHEIQKESWVKMEIKNRKKDHSRYYWVNAEIGPHYDSKGKLIGYSAVSQDITAIKDLEQIQKEIIIVLGSIGESHSKETGEHVKRVGTTSLLLAQYYGLSKKEIAMIELASPMHDIGKIAISDTILNKPGALTEEEWNIMKTHTTEGYKLLSVSERPLLKMAASIAMEHHEHYDGSGYPNGLKAEEISIYGRITALADVFDALSHDRCYKKAWSDEEIFKYIQSKRGTQFDPKLVDIFFKHIDEFLAIRNHYRDQKQS